jgi:uncharacterized protein
LSPATDLPDVNVWVALSEQIHLHHHRAKSYWDSERAGRTAFCGATMMGMLRLLTLPSAMNGRPFGLREAFEKYQEFAELPEVDFIRDSPGLGSLVGAWSGETFFTSRLWTDAWIAAIAITNDCRIVSFDSDFSRFPGLKFLHLKP